MGCSLMERVVIADNLDLESLPNGDPQIYWIPASSFGAFRGANGIRFVTEILSAKTNDSTGAANAQLQWQMQWSIDGRTWNDFVGFPVANYQVDTGDTQQDTLFPDGFESDAPFTRFGLAVSCDTTSYMAFVRLTMNALPFQ